MRRSRRRRAAGRGEKRLGRQRETEGPPSDRASGGSEPAGRPAIPSAGWLLLGPPAAALDPAAPWLTPAERARAQVFPIEPRRADWLHGRLAAKRAIAAWLGEPWSDAFARRLEIATAASGAPAPFLDGAPAPFALSLSHRAGYAAAAVAPAGTALGIDLERIEPRSDAFVADYLTPAETAQVAASPPEDRALLANLIWSAKESALKAQEVGLTVDTRSVEVAISVAGEKVGWRPLSIAFAERRLEGWWRRAGAFVLTLSAYPALRPPLRLEPT